MSFLAMAFCDVGEKMSTGKVNGTTTTATTTTTSTTT
jgi:hypothetical protein